ncbi:perlucin-like protein [Argopecten irradians]|uniref:perlucin-like protein n=1 Tax=Argopecten irradians TaxID=31199 RepID=UPI0037117A49
MIFHFLRGQITNMDIYWHDMCVIVLILVFGMALSELSAKWEQRVYNDGEIFKVIQPSGYISCWKACKLSVDCADITFNKDLLYCGLIRKSPAVSPPIDLTTQLGPCNSHSCNVNERCVALSGGTAVCINAVVCEGKYYQNRCFFVGSAKASWYVGQEQCKASGGSLVTVDSSDVISLLSTMTSEGVYWAGGNDIETEGEWKWIENDQTITTNSWWNTGAPDVNSPGKNCLGVVTASGVWHDVDCSLPAVYICQKYITQ